MKRQDEARGTGDVALQQAYRALAFADRDRQLVAERVAALTYEIAELRALIDGRLKPQITALEHANTDLTKRCRAAEQAVEAGRSIHSDRRPADGEPKA